MACPGLSQTVKTIHQQSFSFFQGTKSIYWTDVTSTFPSKAGPKHQ